MLISAKKSELPEGQALATILALLTRTAPDLEHDHPVLFLVGQW